MKPSAAELDDHRVREFRDTFTAIESEVAKVIVGHADVVRWIVTSFFVGGHVLIEGVPGLGKTRLVRSVADALGLRFRRIQFTPDLMPSDIVGAQILAETAGGREFRFRPGPIFANVVLADEINRATPKTQSAVLEAMEEHQVTSFGETHPVADPFFLLATQNPIELEGTYPLPEAQLDRFLFKLLVDSPSATELKEILRRTTASATREPEAILSPATALETIHDMKTLVREVVLAPALEDVVVEILAACDPRSEGAVPLARSYLRFAPGPRAAQALVLAGKVLALLDGRGNVARTDLVAAIRPALRHRVILNFQADAEGVDGEDVLTEVVGAVAPEAAAKRGSLGLWPLSRT